MTISVRLLSYFAVSMFWSLHCIIQHGTQSWLVFQENAFQTNFLVEIQFSINKFNVCIEINDFTTVKPTKQPFQSANTTYYNINALTEWNYNFGFCLRSTEFLWNEFFELNISSFIAQIQKCPCENSLCGIIGILDEDISFVNWPLIFTILETNSKNVLF